MDNICVLISSPYSYRDAFNISSKLIDKYWRDCPYAKIYVTDFPYELQSVNSSFKIMSSNKNDDWKNRMIFALKQISVDYIILLTDDLLLKKQINQDDITKLMQYIQKENILYTRIYKSNRFSTSKNRVINNYYKLIYNQPYARSLLGGIWNKNFLQTILEANDKNAWLLEEEWNKEGLSLGNIPIPQHLYYHNDFFFHAIYKGKWFWNVKRFLKKNHIHNDSKREYLSRRITLFIFLKGKTRNLLSPKHRYYFKKILAKLFRFDTKY